MVLTNVLLIRRAQFNLFNLKKQIQTLAPMYHTLGSLKGLLDIKG